jgi:hypothetical protein
LNLIVRSAPVVQTRLIVDSVSTHKTPEINRYLLLHPAG